ncbi:enoyl-CoA hydratase/isomerase family protein [Enterococcus sp. AZ109]|uniref:enoyl-CoA hydratase/isomerase family protein n=1 Tax=Enterococcus sp. AZ109 TaxID=2774634 RepID=UPI003F205F16
MNYIEFKKEKHVATILLNRPKQMNAINTDMLKKIDEALDEIHRDKTIRCVLIKSLVPKIFAAGADIEQLAVFSKEEAYAFSKLGQEVLNKLANLRVPSIAQVEGAALGGGTELALACDIRIATEKAKFALPETSLGLIPGWGGTQRLMKAVGYSEAILIMSTGKRISSDEAYRIGLINKQCSAEDIAEETEQIITAITNSAPFGVEFTKYVALSSGRESLYQGLQMEREFFAKTFVTRDCNNGLRAFLGKTSYTYRRE